MELPSLRRAWPVALLRDAGDSVLAQDPADGWRGQGHLMVAPEESQPLPLLRGR